MSGLGLQNKECWRNTTETIGAIIEKNRLLRELPSDFFAGKGNVQIKK